ncbi:hypothetical protein F4779DRAFT_567961 [Xylariaceae sp. FL0662B]|nr:hypothetical protein F4779DRAFT_567961 [Xylariaceae sp. FL0662B]
MDTSLRILQRCQFEGCQSTVLLGGPYCTRHTKETVSGPTAASMGSSSTLDARRHSNDQSSRHPAQRSLQVNGNSSRMHQTAEKTGDAITVKTPLPASGPAVGKKHLSESVKHVARKTTSTVNPKSAQAPTAPHTPDSTASLNRSLVDGGVSGQRPAKRRRLSTGIDKDPESRRTATSAVENNHHGLSGIKPVHIEERNPNITAAGDFALHPNKGTPSASEMLSKPRHRGDRSASSQELKYKISDHKLSHRGGQASANSARGYGFPIHNVIDLTEDDKEQHSYSKSSRSAHTGNEVLDNRKGPEEGSRGSAEEVLSNTQHDRSSIEVQLGLKHRERPIGHFDASARRKWPTNTSDTGSNSTSPSVPSRARTAEKTSLAPILALPRTNAVITPSYMSNTTLAPQHEESRIKQKAPQCARPSIEKPTGSPIENRDQARHAGTILNSIETERNDKTAPSVPGAPSPSSNSSFLSGSNGGHIMSQSTKSKPQARTPQVQASVHDTMPDSNSSTAPKVNGTHAGNHQMNSNISLSAQQAPQAKVQKEPSPIRRPRDVEEPHTPRALHNKVSLRPHLIEPESSTKRPQPQNLSKCRNETTSHGIQKTNGVEASANSSTIASMVRNRSWKNLNPEERRQAWVAKHDPEKFDSYIYGELNEANRPGTALFGQPEYLQPPRPTRPATHFAHLDPRVHWVRPHSQQWYLEKQKEIRERGNRKKGFGQAAARAARNKGAGGAPKSDLPERVLNNPAWLAAVDELDDMAEQYHAKKREIRLARRAKAREKEKGKGKEAAMPSTPQEMDVDPS